MGWFTVTVEAEVIDLDEVVETYAQAMALRCADVCNKLVDSDSGATVIKTSTTYEVTKSGSTTKIGNDRLEEIRERVNKDLNNTVEERRRIEQALMNDWQPLKDKLVLAEALTRNTEGETAEALHSTVEEALSKVKIMETEIREIMKT